MKTKTYFVKIDRKTCKATLVNGIDDADYVFNDWSDCHARMTAETMALREKWDKIGIFDPGFKRRISNG